MEEAHTTYIIGNTKNAEMLDSLRGIVDLPLTLDR